MAEQKVFICDVCGNYGYNLDVKHYQVKYPTDGATVKMHLCPEHAAPLLKLREDLPASIATPSKRGRRTDIPD